MPQRNVAARSLASSLAISRASPRHRRAASSVAETGHHVSPLGGRIAKPEANILDGKALELAALFFREGHRQHHSTFAGSPARPRTSSQYGPMKALTVRTNSAGC